MLVRSEFFAALLAGGAQNAGNDRLAAIELGLHLGELRRELVVGAQRRHALPVVENHRQRRERRAELVRGAGGEQAHADDMLFFCRLLAQLGKSPVLIAHVAIDAGDEQHQQHRRQQKADEHAVMCRLEQPGVCSLRRGRREADVGIRRPSAR